MLPPFTCAKDIDGGDDFETLPKLSRGVIRRGIAVAPAAHADVKGRPLARM